MRTPPTYVVGAAAVTQLGFEWRGLARAVSAGKSNFGSAKKLASTHPHVTSSEVPPVSEQDTVGTPRQRKLMSYSAYLAAIAVHKVISDAGWDSDSLETLGYYLGVGASGASADEINRILGASVTKEGLSAALLGHEGGR